MKAITYSKQSLRTLQRIPATVATKIVEKIEQYAAEPASQANNVKKLQNRDGFRLRVGDWRVIFNETGTVLAIVEIGSRSNIYD